MAINKTSALPKASSDMPSASSDLQKVQQAVTEQTAAANNQPTQIPAAQTHGAAQSVPNNAAQAAAQKQAIQAQPKAQAQPQSQVQQTKAVQSPQPQNGMASNATYTDSDGQQHPGYVIDGITYTDAAGTTPIGVGSTVTLADGSQWYKGENGSVRIGTGAGQVTPVSYTDSTGQQHRGYVIDGVTYTDPYGKSPVAIGSTVTLPDGSQWYKGEYGSTLVKERNLHDLSGLINQQYDAAQKAAQEQVNYGTQQSMDQLMRAMQDAQPKYEDAIANQLLETKQAQDAQALRNQVNGNRGGIGSSQVDSIGNTGAQNREAIAQQQRQLASDTARQIADLRAQGKYTEAQNTLQIAQQRLSALYNEQVRLQQEQTTKETQQLQIEQERQNNLASLAKTLLNAGIMPSGDMLTAIGLDPNLAQAWIDKVNGVDSGSGSGSSSGGSGGDPVINNVGNDTAIYGSDVNTDKDLSANGKRLFDSIKVMNYNSNGSNYASNSLGAADKIVEALAKGQITAKEAEWLGSLAGVRSTGGGKLGYSAWYNMAQNWR